MFTPPTTIRLLFDSPRSGAMNMALDEVLGRKSAGGREEMFVRFYSWEPSALSIGYGQSFRGLDQAALKSDGREWVRRISGGGGVLHQGEITYCFALAFDHRKGDSRSDILSFCSDVLSGCFGSLGIETGVGKTGRYVPVADCFAARGAFELLEKKSGRKIAASAAAIKKGFFLQHGSLPLDSSHRRIEKYLRGSFLPSTRSGGSISLGECVSLSREEILKLFRFYLERRFKVAPFELLQEDLDEARRLAGERYAHPAWLRRR